MSTIDEGREVRPRAFARAVSAFRNWSTTEQAYPLGYLPALDGTRGLMTLGVLAAHTRYLLLPGAVLFMDIFFVMSGYLITSLLINDYRKRGAIDFKKFYARRFLRLYPALAAMLTALLIVAALFSSEFKLRLPELLLMRVDKIGMSVSIEPRVPFLDHKLVEFTMNLPMELKVEGGVPKSILKQAVRGLIPDDIIDRPKMGFGAPMADWLRGPFGRAVEAQILASRFFDRFPARRGLVLDMLRRHRAETADFSLYVWTFYNAVAWFDWWVDKRREARVA